MGCGNIGFWHLYSLRKEKLFEIHILEKNSKKIRYLKKKFNFKNILFVDKNFHENNKNYYDIINLNFTNINTQIIYGKTDLLDTIHAKRMKKHKSIKIIRYDANHQTIFKKLKKDNQLIDIINKSIKIS